MLSPYLRSSDMRRDIFYRSVGMYKKTYLFHFVFYIGRDNGNNNPSSICAWLKLG